MHIHLEGGAHSKIPQFTQLDQCGGMSARCTAGIMSLVCATDGTAVSLNHASQTLQVTTQWSWTMTDVINAIARVQTYVLPHLHVSGLKFRKSNNEQNITM